MLRTLLGFFGYVVGPIVGYSYLGLMRILNGGRTLPSYGRKAPGGAKSLQFTIVTGARGVPKGKTAVTLRNKIYTRAKIPSPRLINHELVHVEQYKEMGTLRFFARYGGEIGKRGYRGNLLEQEARTRAGV